MKAMNIANLKAALDYAERELQEISALINAIPEQERTVNNREFRELQKRQSYWEWIVSKTSALIEKEIREKIHKP